MADSAGSGTCFCFLPSSKPRRKEVVDSSSEKSVLERSLGTSCWTVVVPRRILLPLPPLRRFTGLLFRHDVVGRVVGAVGCAGGDDDDDDDDDACIVCLWLFHQRGVRVDGFDNSAGAGAIKSDFRSIRMFLV